MTKKQPSNHSDQDIPQDVRGILGKRVLLSGEKPKPYDRLFKLMAAECKPEGVIDWLYLNDFADLIFDTQRIRSFQQAIINSSWLESLERLLDTATADDENCPIEYGAPRADAFLHGDVKTKKYLAARMKKYGFDANAILADAFARKIDVLETANRMRDAADARREKVLRDFYRRREAFKLSCEKRARTDHREPLLELTREDMQVISENAPPIAAEDE